MPLVRSVSARRPKAPCRLWYSAEPAQGNLERALQLVGRVVLDVGEDAALGGLVDERGVVALEHCDHGAVCLAHDAIDQLERVRGAVAEAHERNVRVFAGCERADLGDVRRSGDDGVPKPGHERRHERDAILPLVRNQNAQMVGRQWHQVLPSCSSDGWTVASCALSSTQAWRGFRVSTW